MKIVKSSTQIDIQRTDEQNNDDDEDSWQRPVLVSGSAVQLNFQRISIIKVCYLSPGQTAILCAVQYMNNVQSKSIVFSFSAYSTAQHY